MSGLPTPSSVALRFDCSRNNAKAAWKQEILVNLLSKLAATPGLTQQRVLHSLLTEIVDPVSASVKRTDRSEWHSVISRSTLFQSCAGYVTLSPQVGPNHFLIVFMVGMAATHLDYTSPRFLIGRSDKTR